MEKIGRRIIWLISKCLNVIFAVVLFILFLIGTYALWDSQLVYAQADATKWETYKPEINNQVGFDELRKMNPDAHAWLNIYGTHIDYPVMYSDTNIDFYLYHDPMGTYSASGSLFLLPPDKPDFSQFKTIIYGHHMAYNAMFGEISNFDDIKFMESHKYGKLSYLDKNGVLQTKGLSIVAFIETEAYDNTIYNRTVSFSQGNQFRKEMLNRAKHTLNVSYDGERVVLLSTCAGESTNGRAILMCYITDTVHDDPYPPVVNKGLGIDKLQGLFGFPWLGWFGILLLFCLLILLIIYLVDRYKSYRNEKKLRMNS